MQKVAVFAAKVVPGDLLVLPWGWAVAEQSLNNEINSGVRWIDMREEGTPGLRALMSMVCPKPSEVKANTSAGFLLKVVDAGVKSLAERNRAGIPAPGRGSGGSTTAKQEQTEKERDKKRGKADQVAPGKPEAGAGGSTSSKRQKQE